MENMHKTLLKYTEVGWLSQGKALVQRIASELAAFPVEHHFYSREQVTGRLWLFRPGCLTDIFLKMNEKSLSYQEK